MCIKNVFFCSCFDIQNNTCTHSVYINTTHPYLQLNLGLACRGCQCVTILLNHYACTQYVLNLYFLGKSMNNLSSYGGLTDSKMRASDTDLPVTIAKIQDSFEFLQYLGFITLHEA